MFPMSRRKIVFELLVATVVVGSFLFVINSHVAQNWRHSISWQQQRNDTSRPRFIHSEQMQRDGVIVYERKLPQNTTISAPESEPDLLWLAMTNNVESWGQRKGFIWTTDRTFEDYLSLVLSQVDTSSISLGLLTSSIQEYELYKSILRNYDFPRVVIFMHPGFDTASFADLDREHRHDRGDLQTLRRAELAKLRNYLMLKTLRSESHIIWLDADIYYLEPNLVRRMLQHSKENHDIGMLTARCGGKGIDDYDRNAWRGTRQGPRGWDLNQKEIDAGELKSQGQKHIADMYKGTDNDELIELTTVGATILYIRASLIWQGLSFPHQFVVGTRWGKDGWDGIESEGLCYRSRGLQGGKCAFLGGKWHIEHTSH